MHRKHYTDDLEEASSSGTAELQKNSGEQVAESKD